MTSPATTSCSKERGTNMPPNFQDAQEGLKPELPKIWNIEDPFQYAPPKPEGDPWTLLLEPLLKKDKLQCDAWKDEVQNLLIFAGLFSAVVTALIVESYKDLQPDPNEVMISLLAHIATRLDNQTSSTSSPLSLTETFSPAASAIRINVFWFISLILSLTSVLVGIISLQWLREHQSYTGFSSREAYAVFNMRAEGMKSWHVDRVFMTLPLLLQCALVLFLGGVIDFLHAFRQWAVVIPVAAVIGLALLFLVATTLLPTMQTLSLYVSFNLLKKGGPSDWPYPPSQCPFKSPQSHAVRRLCKPLLNLPHALMQRWRSYRVQNFLFRVTHPFSSRWLFSLKSVPKCYFYIRGLNSWTWDWHSFDKSWLVIRDAYMRRAFDLFNHDADYIGYYPESNDIFPIFDIVMGLLNSKDDKTVVDTAYHCISGLSETALLPLIKTSNWEDLTPRDRLRQNVYLYNLLIVLLGIDDLSDFFNIDAYFDGVEQGDLTCAKRVSCLLHQQNLLAYTTHSDRLFTHRRELTMRLFKYFYQGQHELRVSNTTLNLPKYLSFISFNRYSSAANTAPVFNDEDTFESFAWQFADLTLSIFRQLDQEFHPHSLVHTSFAQENGLGRYLKVSSFVTLKALSPPVSVVNGRPSSSITRATVDKFHSVFTYIRQSLETHMASWSDGHEQPSLQFYLAAAYVHDLVQNLPNDESFSSLCNTILEYRKRTIDKGKVDSVLEIRLLGGSDVHIMYPNLYDRHKFSSIWWSAFDILDHSAETPDPSSMADGLLPGEPFAKQ